MSTTKLQNILEFCGRIETSPKEPFNEFLKSNINTLNKDCIYIIVAIYLNEESKKIISNLVYKGLKIKVIDVSLDNNVSVNGIETIHLKKQEGNI